VQLAGRTRAQVLAELIDAQRNGDTIVNAEIGLTARQMYPQQYAGVTGGGLRAGLGNAAQYR
jgi:hypothetical protein